MFEITIDDMPNEDLKIIATAVGIDVAMCLIDNLPGTQIQIPVNYNINSTQIKFLEKYIDDKIIKKLQSCYGGLSVTIPRSAKAIVNSAKIVKEFNGTNANELALEYGCSRKFIYNLIHRDRDKKQPRLF